MYVEKYSLNCQREAKLSLENNLKRKAKMRQMRLRTIGKYKNHTPLVLKLNFNATLNEPMSLKGYPPPPIKKFIYTGGIKLYHLL